jgi:hypothetical protein
VNLSPPQPCVVNPASTPRPAFDRTNAQLSNPSLNPSHTQNPEQVVENKVTCIHPHILRASQVTCKARASCEWWWDIPLALSSVEPHVTACYWCNWWARLTLNQVAMSWWEGLLLCFFFHGEHWWNHHVTGVQRSVNQSLPVAGPIGPSQKWWYLSPLSTDFLWTLPWIQSTMLAHGRGP